VGGGDPGVTATDQEFSKAAYDAMRARVCRDISMVFIVVIIAIMTFLPRMRLLGEGSALVGVSFLVLYVGLSIRAKKRLGMWFGAYVSANPEQYDRCFEEKRLKVLEGA
jgi:hypothetical protein